MMDFLMEARSIKDTVVAHRRALHRCAEVGFELKNTVAYVKQALEKLGIEAQDCGRSGVVCTIGQGERTFLLRADMDALPIVEKAGQEFDSVNGCMHACGHDIHTAMLLGAAEILKSHEKDLPGRVKCMFQPAEEMLMGARDMLENGVLQEPAPEAGMMVHVMTGVPLPAGTVITAAPGVSAPAASMFEIRIQGRGGHGASPEGTVDPLPAAAHTMLALQSIKARELPAQSGAMLTIGAIMGGEAPNVIADHVLLRGSLRAYSEKEHAFLCERAREIAEMTAGVFGATATFQVTSSAPTLLNAAEMVQLAERELSRILGEEKVKTAADMGGARSSGSEDFACISHEIPTVMLALAAGDAREGYVHGLHHPATRFDEGALPYGVAAMTGLAVRYLEDRHA